MNTTDPMRSVSDSLTRRIRLIEAKLLVSVAVPVFVAIAIVVRGLPSWKMDSSDICLILVLMVFFPPAVLFCLMMGRMEPLTQRYVALGRLFACMRYSASFICFMAGLYLGWALERQLDGIWDNAGGVQDEEHARQVMSMVSVFVWGQASFIRTVLQYILAAICIVLFVDLIRARFFGTLDSDMNEALEDLKRGTSAGWQDRFARWYLQKAMKVLEAGWKYAVFSFVFAIGAFTLADWLMDTAITGIEEWLTTSIDEFRQSL